MKIEKIDAIEILDSRGNPTVEVILETESGEKVKAKVPSGASTGSHEALELRDNDEARYGGKGVLRAIANIRGIIAPAIVGMEAVEQEAIDRKMLELDGTPLKSNLGANAILGVSLAVARAAAMERKQPLYVYLRQLMYGEAASSEIILPVPMCNIVNGGAHADSGLDIQEYMIIPNGISSFQEKMRAVSQIYQTLKSLLKDKGHATAVGDEGGFAPRLSSNEEPLQYMVAAIEKAGFKPGQDVSLGMDAAASEFYDKASGKYLLKLDGKELGAEEMAQYYAELVQKYPIILIEDGMAEDDVPGWVGLTAQCGANVAIMGDDFTVTSKARLQMAVENKALNSVLIKVNQIGSLTETLECLRYASENNIRASVSHRSGETSDDFIADLAAGVGTAWIKSGAPARSERVEKYNRLIEIEHDLGQ